MLILLVNNKLYITLHHLGKAVIILYTRKPSNMPQVGAFYTNRIRFCRTLCIIRPIELCTNTISMCMLWYTFVKRSLCYHSLCTNTIQVRVVVIESRQILGPINHSLSHKQPYHNLVAIHNLFNY